MNRFVACSRSSAGCSPDGGGPTCRSGSRTGAGTVIGPDAAVVFGLSITSVIVVSRSVPSGGPEHGESRGPLLSVRGSRGAPLGHQKTVDLIRPTARGVCVGGHAAVAFTSTRAQISRRLQCR